jgi:hypothetical protein
MMMNNVKEKEMNHDTFHGYMHPAVTQVFTTKQLVDQLFSNLRDLAGNSDKNAYLAGYLSACLADIAEKGVDELTAIVDYTNQQIEVREYNKRADARREAFENGEYA